MPRIVGRRLAHHFKPGIVHAKGNRANFGEIAKGPLQGRPHPFGVGRQDRAALPQHGAQQGLHTGKAQQAKITAQHGDQCRRPGPPQGQGILEPVDVENVGRPAAIGAAQPHQQGQDGPDSQRPPGAQQVRDTALLRQASQPQCVGRCGRGGHVSGQFARRRPKRKSDIGTPCQRACLVGNETATPVLRVFRVGGAAHQDVHAVAF